MGDTAESPDGGWTQCSCEGIAGADRIRGRFSELCGDDVEKCIQGYTAVRVACC